MREHSAIGKCQPSCDQGCGVADNALAEQVWRWKACLRKAGHRAAGNIGTRHCRIKGGIHGGGDLIIEGYPWNCLKPVWRVAGEFVESNDASRSDRCGRPPDHGYRIALMRE